MFEVFMDLDIHLNCEISCSLKLNCENPLSLEFKVYYYWGRICICYVQSGIADPLETSLAYYFGFLKTFQKLISMHILPELVMSRRLLYSSIFQSWELRPGRLPFVSHFSSYYHYF